MKFWILILYFSIAICSAQDYTFPDDFKFGVASAAYQVEGAWNISGKGESIWDRLTHSNPEAVVDQSNGDVACDTYSKTKEDVQLLRQLGVHFYRFSISWSRILPSGKKDFVNPDGIRYYDELINELLANNIEPIVTMHHYDLPQPLEDDGGFQNLAIADYFEDYADVLFENFGDRVKIWITFNEPVSVCYYGYAGEFLAPMLNDIESGYLCGRTLLIAHAKAYHLYNSRYRESQRGRIGIINHIFCFEPDSNNPEDVQAVEAAQQFMHGWAAHPIFSKDGDYPRIMKEKIAESSKQEGLKTSRLPEFTLEEIETIRGTADFMGINHYTTYYCRQITHESIHDSNNMLYLKDMGVICVDDKLAEPSATAWLRVVPFGIRKSLQWVKNNYDNPEVFITENGISNSGEVTVNDCRRINYYNSYLTEVLKAIHEDGCNVSRYTAWSFMDNFEWRSGYSEKFGLYAVDFNDSDRARIPKMSAHVYKKIIEDKRINWKYTPEGFTQCEWATSREEL